MSIGLALSGGGAKGIAHIGVLEALKDYGITIDYIAGTSSGSIMASLHAAGYTPNEMLRIVTENKGKLIDYDKGIGFKLLKTVVSKKISIKGFIKGNNLERIIRKKLRQKDISDISNFKMPIAIPAVNLQTGEIAYFSNVNIKNCHNSNENEDMTFAEPYFDDEPSCFMEGEVADIVRASCSFPGVFIPKKINNNEYIDGGVRVNTPVNILKGMGADKIIAISFNCNKRYNVSINNIIGISDQAFNILSHSANKSEAEQADVNIKLCFNDVSLLDVSNYMHIAKRGYNIIARNIIEIKKRLGIK